MDRTLLAGLAVAATAATLLNVGKGVQKMKVQVLKKGRRAFQKENRRDLGIWVIGFLMTASASGLYSYALKLTDKAGLVSATSGLGIVGLVIFAALVLKERFGRREQLGTAGVIAGTVLVSVFNQPLPFDPHYPVGRLVMVTGVVVITSIVACALAWRANRLCSLAFGATAGSYIAIAMVFGDLALIEAGNDFIGQLSNPYPYVATAIGLCALAVTQLAFFRGRAMVVVPTINSFMIGGPPLIEYLVLGTALAPMQLVGMAVIVAGVVLLTTTSEGIRAK
jgi:drug/metabolite transporter (DMT)-like permease